LINGAETEDWALTTSTQATTAIDCEVHNDCDAVSDAIVVLHLQF
jgi:hypothetical protein